MSTLSNAGFGVIENYVADVAVTMMFGLGYYLFKGLKKRDDSFCDPTTNFKNMKGKLEGALQRWQYAKTIEEYNDLINTNYEGIEDPFTIINLMNKGGVMPNIDTYNALLYNCLLTQNNEAAQTLKDEMMDPTGPVTPNIYTLNVLIKGLHLKFKEKLRDSKVPVFHEFDRELIQVITTLEERNVYCDLIVQNTILDILVDQNRLEQAWSQFDNMRRIFKPDLYTYLTLLKAIKSAPEVSEEWLAKAFLILNEAKNHCDVDEQFVNNLLEACIKFNRIDKAEQVFCEMSMRKKKVTSEASSCIMIRAYSKIYNFNKASKIFEEIEDKSATSYDAMMSAAIRCKNFEYAERLLTKLQDTDKCLSIYANLINGFRLNKNYEKGIKIYDQIKDKTTLTCNIYQAVLLCCVESNKVEKMDEIFESFQNSGDFDASLYTIVLKGFAKNNNVEKVSELYSILKNRTQLKLDEILYNCIIDCYARQNDEANLLKVYNDMKENLEKITVVTYGILIKLYCSLGNCSKAFEIFEDCIRAGVKPSVVIYHMLIKLQIKSRFVDRAVTLFNNMVVNGIKPDGPSYELIIKSCLDSEKVAEASELVLNAIKDSIKIDKYLYDELIEKTSASEEIKQKVKSEFASNVLSALKASKMTVDRSITDKLSCIVKSYFDATYRSNNNYYDSEQSIYNVNRTSYNPRTRRSQNNVTSDKSIYDAYNSKPQYSQKVYRPQRTYKVSTTWSQRNYQEEEKSIYS